MNEKFFTMDAEGCRRSTEWLKAIGRFHEIDRERSTDGYTIVALANTIRDGMHPIKKYRVCPGYVTSQNDGDRHFISFDQLVALYGVSREDCHCYDPTKNFDPAEHKDMIALKPRYDGNYSLPS